MTRNIELEVNGANWKVFVSATETLLLLLRRLGYFEVKFSCGQGECGVCVVELNGRIVNSCMVLAISCDGAKIRTSKAFGSTRSPGVVQSALGASGGVQCGYCIPGLVTATASTLEARPETSKEELINSLDGHLCRCTGYIKQLDALKSLTKGCLKKDEPEFSAKIVGRSVIKGDAMAMACGRVLYCDDGPSQQVLSIALVLSTECHARVVDIDVSLAMKNEGVVSVITCFELPEQKHQDGPSLPESMLGDNYLLTSKPRYVGDRIAAVVARSEEIARAAIKKIKVTYEKLEAAVTVEEALADDAPCIGQDGNVIARRDYCRLNDQLEIGRERVEALIDANIPAASPGFAEPYSCVTHLDANGRLIVRTSTQVPYFVRWVISLVCSLPVSRIRVIKPHVGGGFGAKQDVVVEALCALVTLRTGQSARLVLDRQEVFKVGRHRHPAKISALGNTIDGSLGRLTLDVTLDKGAYPPHGSSLLLCCASRALPMYRWREIEFSGRTVLTNKPSSGGLRGYGGPQSVFAVETLIDELAIKSQIDPLEFRLVNAIGKNSSLEIINELAGQDDVVPSVLQGDWPRVCLERGAEKFGWHDKRLSYKDEGRYRRGAGVAWAMQGPSSFSVMRSSATVQLNEDGTFRIISGAADIGTGAETVLAQMAAETLGVSLEDIQVVTGDTDPTLYDAGAYASSTTWNAGGAVTIAAQRARDALLSLASRLSQREVCDLKVEGRKIISSDGKWSRTLAQIAMEVIGRPELSPISVTVSHGPRKIPPSFNAQFVDLVVDTLTGKIEVHKVISVVDCGQPINPSLCRGQMEGAIAMGLSMALTEELTFNKRGIIVNSNFSTYQLMRMLDMPSIEVEFVQSRDDGVPYHAKSIGEIGCMPPMAAVSNALAHAIGVRLCNPPFTPWKVLEALHSLDE